MKKILIPMLMIFFISSLYASETKTYKIGDLELIALKDTDTNMGKSILLEPNDEIVAKIMPDNQNPSSINSYVLKIEDSIILVDAGFGRDKTLIDNLKSVDINPLDIDIIMLTHMHSDHIGGLVDEKGVVFPNATLFISKDELDYQLNNKDKSSDMAKNVYNLYKDNIKTFSWGESLLPQIKATKALGHTPGHTFFEITSNNDKIVIVADVVHSLKVQLAKPSMSVVFDTDPVQAAKTRIELFEQISKDKTKIVGMHIPFPGVGYILNNDDGSYRFESLDR